MRRLLAIILTFCTLASYAQQAIGTWREHLPYGETIDVAFGNDRVYCATPFSVFAYSKVDQSLERISKVNLLSGSDLSSIDFDPPSSTLLVGYTTGELDIITNGSPFNLADIAQSNVIGDKAIYDITIVDGLAYLSCGFGIVVVDINNREVRETWFINGQSNLIRINTLDFDETYWYAATEEGIYRAERSNPFLVSFEAWELMTDTPDEDAEYSELMVFKEDIFLVRENGFEDELWVANRNDLNFTILPGYESEQVVDLNHNEDHVVISTFNKVTVVDEAYAEVGSQQGIQGNAVIPRAALIEGETIWIASEFGGLLSFELSGPEAAFQPAGPPAFNVRRIDAFNDNIWIASGGVDPTWTNNYDKKGIYGLVNDQWIIAPQSDGENDIGSINDYMTVSVNPTNNNNIFLGSWEEGLIEVNGGEITEIWNDSDSPLELANFGGSPRIGVGGVDFDPNGNLWFANAYTDDPLMVRTAGNSFVSFNFQPEVDSDIFIGDIVATRQGYIWSILPRGHGIVVLNHNETIGDTSDDSYQVLTNEEGEGGLPTLDVYCLEEDLDGEMWVGTLQGIAVFFSPESIFNGNNFDAQQILIEQDGNIQILLETEQVNCIEIDGANRKWVGTANSGVFLFSEDGLSQIQHFTEESSPLLSNNVVDIAINQRNGEIFFGTDRGIISYTGTATNFDQEISEVSVYPNPVREDYEGIITIDGLAFETDVKVTDVSGNIVYTTTSLGGRATWDGNDRYGKRVSTGVYLVFCTTEDGKATNVAKVAVVR
ncbi:MAG: T9SS type A sorting domain-containing protein [Flavobacteriales bacterium]|nr:T9SS type A sorting domain-containing protein [Flavobacteriales bacterium]